jgi:hypothetical protein
MTEAGATEAVDHLWAIPGLSGSVPVATAPNPVPALCLFAPSRWWPNPSSSPTDGEVSYPLFSRIPCWGEGVECRAYRQEIWLPQARSVLHTGKQGLGPKLPCPACWATLGKISLSLGLCRRWGVGDLVSDITWTDDSRPWKRMLPETWPSQGPAAPRPVNCHNNTLGGGLTHSHVSLRSHMVSRKPSQVYTWVLTSSEAPPPLTSLLHHWHNHLLITH